MILSRVLAYNIMQLIWVIDIDVREKPHDFYTLFTIVATYIVFWSAER